MELANLDMDVLRTLAVAMDLGGFGKAAERLGRSQSAVSLQMRRLEERVGRPLFRREGRGLGLTDAGDVVLGYARQILELNDQAVAAARGIEQAHAVYASGTIDPSQLKEPLAKSGIPSLGLRIGLGE